MRPDACIRCSGLRCAGVRHDRLIVPGIDVDPGQVSVVMISEVAPERPADYYYAGGNALFEQTTVQAFCDAEVAVAGIEDILGLGVYLTTAVKCGKTGYGIPTATIKACSCLLEQELALFPAARVYMLMGDVAIKSLNHIAQRAGEKRVIPAGSTYKLRGPEYSYRGIRVFPSYLQAGPSFFIEKSKRRMIAEDIAAAMSLLE